MIDTCEYAVKLGEKSADEVEAFWIKKVSTTVKAEMGEINTTMSTGYQGIRIRVVKNKAVGSAFSSKLDKDSVNQAIDRALAASRAAGRDEYWDSLPFKGKYPHVMCDPRMEYIEPEVLAAPVMEILGSLPDDIRVRSLAHEVILQERGCVNSNGVEHEDKGSQENLALYAVGTLKEGVTPSFYEASFSKVYNPNPSLLVGEVTRKIDLFKNREHASPGQVAVVLTPFVLLKLFYYTLFKALTGDTVTREKSFFTGKRGENVADSLFTLHDNGTIQEGISSREMDDEGIPCQDTPLIEKGILKGFIWNDYWAKRTGGTSTGNAHYNDRMGVMSIQQSNMVVYPGRYTNDQLFDIKEGYYIEGVQGAHGSNPESGDFSVVCTPAYRIREGALSGGVTGMMLSDNVYSLLQKIDGVGRDVEVREFAILPPIRFRDVNAVAR